MGDDGSTDVQCCKHCQSIFKPTSAAPRLQAHGFWDVPSSCAAQSIFNAHVVAMFCYCYCYAAVLACVDVQLRVFVLLLLSCCAAVLELLAARPKVKRRDLQTGQNLWGGGYRSSYLACGAVGVRRSPAENAEATDPPPRPPRFSTSARRYEGA